MPGVPPRPSLTQLEPDPAPVPASDWLGNFLVAAKTITATVEILPFPFVREAIGPIVPILESVQRVSKNREDFKDICSNVIEIVTMLRDEIVKHGAVAAARFEQLCEKLESLLREVQQNFGKLQKRKKSFILRFKEFTKSHSTQDELAVFKARLNDLRTNFILIAAMNADLNITELSALVKLNIDTAIKPVPSSLPPVATSCPPPSRIFHGRKDILLKMHEYFSRDVGKRHISLLHGLGGSGKTQIALKFIDESVNSRFVDVFFIDASTLETIRGGFTNIAVTRSIGTEHQAALQWLATSTEEWLLVFDNADDPDIDLYQFFPPSTGGNILITSRNPQLCTHAPGAHYQVSNMEEDDAVQLLLTSSSQEVTDENLILAREIVQILHSLPLAVVQAGSFITKTGALGKYISLYQQNHTRLFSERPTQSHDKYAESVYTTWDISFQRLGKPAARFLQLCSFLHHEGISEDIFSKAVSYEPEGLEPPAEDLAEARDFLANFLTDSRSWDSLAFANMVAEIRGYSLINQDPKTDRFSIHPLVHKWSRNTISNIGSMRECITAIVAMSVFGSNKVFRVRLLPHLGFLLEDPLLAHRFCWEYAWIYSDAGQFQIAGELDVVALAKQKQVLGIEHLDTLRTMANLASIHRAMGRFKEAEELEVVVLEMRTKILGPEHVDTLRAMGNLAASYWHLGKFKEAEKLEVVVLENRKQILGTEHSDTILATADLAGIYRGLGRFSEAERLEIEVLEKSRQIFGADHPETLTGMANLALTYGCLQKFHDAEELGVVVLEKRKKILGKEHPGTLGAMAQLGSTYRHLKKLEDAVELQVFVVEKRKQILGPDHPDTLTASGNLASTYWDLGRYLDAEGLQTVVFEKNKESLGLEHPRTLTAMTNLSATYQSLEKFKEAEELNMILQDNWKHTLTLDSDPKTLGIMADLGATYQCWDYSGLDRKSPRTELEEFKFC